MLRTSITQVFCLYCALTLGSVSASTIYSNLADGNNGTLSIRTSSDFTQASEFLTPVGTTLTLDDVVIELGEASGTNSITAFLYSNTGTTPNASLATIATVPHSSIALTPGLVAFIPGSTITLQPNTEYWIVLSGTSIGANDAEWQIGTTNAGTGVAGQNHAQFNGAAWITFPNNVNTNTIPEMQIDATAAAPEPATFTLMGAALAGLAIVTRRRKR